MMRNTSYLLMGAALGAGLMFGVSQVGWLAQAQGRNTNADTYRQLNLFGDVFERVRADYVEQPNDVQLIETAINGMLTSLDPHSNYLSPKNFRDMQVQTRGEFGGLGIEVTMEGGLVKVVSPIDDTPAQRAGIRPGDLITYIDDEPVQGLTLQQAVDKMRGAVGSTIRIKVQRGTDEQLEFKITRDMVKIQSVRVRVEGEEVGYIRITQFSEQTTEGVRKAIETFNKDLGDKLKGIVIDLRNNPGGLLDQAIGVCDVFLDRGEIVSTRGRHAEETQRYNARSGDMTHGKPIIILVNGGSASASEIVAGALQDHHRATILGTLSFGKGSVQTIIPLGQNGAIRLTTARYYTPSGRSIQAKGIDPDIVIQPDVPENERTRNTDTQSESQMRGHLRPVEGEERTGSSAYVSPDPSKDNQLQMAVQLIRGQIQNAAFPPKGDQIGRQGNAN